MKKIYIKKIYKIYIYIKKIYRRRFIFIMNDLQHKHNSSRAPKLNVIKPCEIKPCSINAK